MTSKTTSHSGHLQWHNFFTVCLLLVLNASLQAHCDSIEEIGSASGCFCSEGYECVEGQCIVKDPCQNDCSNEATAPLCASNALTYPNLCTFEKQRCLEDERWLIVYHETCVTLPPPPEDLCKQKQEKYRAYTDEEYNDRCKPDDIIAKGNNGTLELSDVINCYEPTCAGDDFFPFQCIYGGWCWCTDPTGVSIQGTFKQGLNDEECSSRDACMYQGTQYPDATLFTPPSDCGLCECLDGIVSCFEDYVPSGPDNHLNASQLEKLENELTQLFLFQYFHDDHVLIDIRHIHQHPITISPARKRKVIEWKFNQYDRNSNIYITPGETTVFRDELNNFFKCSSFFNHVTEHIDANGDEVITMDEWGSFFGVEMQPKVSDSSASGKTIEKRSTSILTPAQLRLTRFEKKKRFYYTLA